MDDKLSVTLATRRKETWFFALLPWIPVLYFRALAFFGQWRNLDVRFRRLLLIFAGCEVVAGLLAPVPWLSAPLGGARAALMIALILLGYHLKQSQVFRPLMYGYLALFVTALVSQYLTFGGGMFTERLGHPLYYYVPLGLLATITIWLLVFWFQGPLWLRVLGSLGAFAILILTASRGPLLALVVGLTVAGLMHPKSRKPLVGMFLVVLATLVLLKFSPDSSLNLYVERFLNSNLSGRDQVWASAWKAFLEHPWGGVGPYQLGYHLSLFKDLQGGCQLTPWLEANGIHCPSILVYFQGAWLIAHNFVLHSLGEAGVIGTLPLLVLYVWAGMYVFRSRDVFLVALYSGFMTMNLIDATTLVPDMHYGALFWMGIGMACWQVQNRRQESVTE